ncbi:MAG: hypothetical protein L0K86_16100, partial [Actinomycetia bacterium]|nr:hypothetical protein [Actinomycetes bacterium]
MMGRLRVLVPIAATAALLAVLAPDAAAAPVRMKAVEITTVPPTPEARFALDDVPLVTDASGVARTQVPRSVQPHRIALLTPSVRGEGSASEFVRWYGAADSDQVYSPVLEGVRIDHTLRLRVAFRESRVVTFAFVDQQRRPVDIGRVDSIALRSDANQSQTLDARLPVSLVAVRPSTVDGQLVGRAATYAVQSVMIDGANVVNAGEQRFRPSQVGAQLVVVVLLRTAHLQVRDRLLG